MNNRITTLGKAVVRALAPSLNRLNTWVQAQARDDVASSCPENEVTPHPGDRERPSNKVVFSRASRTKKQPLKQPPIEGYSEDYSEEQNRAILSAIPDILTVVNAEGVYQSISYNQFSGERIPLDNMDVTGKPIADVLPPKAAAQKLDAVKRALATGELQLYEQKIPFGDRIQYEEVRVVPYRLDRALCMVRDISDRKRTEHALQQSEAKQRALIRALPDLIMQISKDGIYLDFFTTDQFCVLGDRESMIGTRVEETLLPNLSQKRIDTVRKALETGELQVYEQDLWIDGRLQTEECRVVVCNDNEALIIVRDITERKRAVAQLESQNVLLARIARGEPLTDVLHALIEHIEQTLPDAICSILLVDAAHRLQYRAGQSLPEAYVQQLRDIPIGEGQGTCGTAAFRKQTVIAADIATNPLWEKYRDLCLRHGLQACWSTPIMASDGQVLGVFGVYYRDVRSPRPHELETIAQIANIAGIALEREQAETDLRNQRNLLRAFLDNLPHIAWFKDVEGRFITVNAAFGASCGYSPDEIVGKTDEDCWPPELAHAYRQDDLGVMASRQQKRVEEQLVTTDGKICWIDTIKTPIYDAQNEILGTVGIAIDITDRKRIELALRKTEERYSLATRAAKVGVWEWNLKTQEVYIDPNIKALAGYTDQTFSNTVESWLQLAHPDDRDRMIATVQNYLNGTIPELVFEHRVLHQDGSTIWILVRGQLLRDDQGNPERLIGTDTDISNLKATELRLQQSNHLLSAITEAQTQFIADADPDVLFDKLLETLLQLTNSEYGFIGEILYTDKGDAYVDEAYMKMRGKSYLKTKDITGLSWNDKSHQFYAENVAHSMEFHNLNTLFGQVMVTGQPVISNDSSSDSIRDGLPEGHPTLHAFLGVPFYRGDQLVGMVGLANRAEGYDEAVVTDLKPFLTTCASTIEAYRNDAHRKAAEEALRKSEERWQLAIEGSNDGIWDHDLTLNEYFLSPRCLEILGYDNEMIRSFERWLDQVHEDDRLTLQTTFQAYLERKTPIYAAEYRMRCKDGSYKWLLSRGKAFWDETGTPLRAIGSISDITLRKEAETNLQQLNEELELRVQQRNEALIRSEQDLRTIFNNVYDAILIHDMDGTILDANDRALELRQASREQLLGANIPDLSAPDAPLEQLPEILQRVQHGETMRFEWRERRFSDQVSFDVEVSLRKVTLSNRPVILAGVRDISDRKQAEASLRDSEERLRLALTAANQGLYDLNLQTGEAIVSPEYATMLGYDPAEFRGSNAGWIERLHPDDWEAVAEAYRAYIAGEIADYQVEFRQRTQDRQWKWILSLGKIVAWDESGQPLRMLGTHTDITDRKRLEQELRQINTELEQRVAERTLDLQQAMEAAETANRAKSAFLANMSHELRTPLNAILGFAQLMSRDRTLDTEKHQQLSIINRSGEHLLHLINDILEMSKIEAGRASFAPTHFNLHHLLDTLSGLFRLRATEKGLQFRVERTSTLPLYIETDENKLRQVLINLVGNAVKFTAKGHVIIRVHEPSEPLQSTTPIGTSMMLQFDVEDTGPGIDRAEIDLLFEPFTQSRMRQGNQEGTGLGLAISRQFVQLMGGELTVTSVPGVGSTFGFAIPVQVVEAPALRETLSSRTIVGLAPGQPSYRILVVEDHETNRQLLVQLLQSVGFAVETATNGEEAIALWEHWHPHLIWMDMRIPIMNGYEATRQIRQRETQLALDPTVVIALTASAFEEDRERVLDVGCDDFVRKPFQERSLLEKMAEYLGVQYLYADSTPPPPEPSHTSDSEDAIASLKGLSPLVLKQLYQSTVQLDSQQLYSLIEQIALEHPNLALVLTQKVDNFDLDQILALLQKVI